MANVPFQPLSPPRNLYFKIESHKPKLECSREPLSPRKMQLTIFELFAGPTLNFHVGLSPKYP
ncbi:predicted protein [Botrytis cinerea T4]|uniref:Uncharacterized protein n=1 Tax=Botryotinia fuckeliana (strain T4) TaxID=999810 RepID=G2YP55_BOTF4|nr:predicted protein [Botrytis cinerea T4]